MQLSSLDFLKFIALHNIHFIINTQYQIDSPN